jgi:hypothetical protein
MNGTSTPRSMYVCQWCPISIFFKLIYSGAIEDKETVVMFEEKEPKITGTG